MRARSSLLAAVAWLGCLACTDPAGARHAPEHALEPPGPAPVRIGWGCIDVPRDYRVIAKETTIIDQAFGFVLAPGKPEVEWMFGFSQAHPYCRLKCRVMWQRKEIAGGREQMVGVLNDAGTKASFVTVTDDFITFRADVDDAPTLDYLRTLAAGYRRREDLDRCRVMERP